MHEQDILYENATHWVYANPGKSWYEVYKIGVTHSVRVARIGKNYGVNRSIAEADKRNA